MSAEPQNNLSNSYQKTKKVTLIQMHHFNLIDSPWIPVRNLEEGNRLVSLDTLFREASGIADLDCLPHERIALMRLLVCITQAELGAPESPDDWDNFGHDLETRIPAYLRREDVYPHFNLFGDGPRFLQSKVQHSKSLHSISKIVFHFSSGNNPTLLDHSGESVREIAPDFLARSILCYQSFFVGGSMASAVKGNGPALKYLHCLLIGDRLRSTILLNCIDQQLIKEHFRTIGVPSWATNAPESSGYLNRLFNHTCKLWISDDCQKILIESGFRLPEHPEQRDAFSTEYVRNNERYLLRADLVRGIWRDLHLITLLRKTGEQEQQAPLNLQSHFSHFLENKVTLWLGELYKHEKLAKIIDVVESSFTIPQAMFTDIGRARYEAGIRYADEQSNQLYGAVKQYGTEMKNESPPTNLAKQHYWNALEQQSPLLLKIACQSEPMTENFGEGNDPWTVAVRKAARDAYDYVCPRQTPRQIQAYAAGLKILLAKSNGSKTSTRRKPNSP